MIIKILPKLVDVTEVAFRENFQHIRGKKSLKINNTQLRSFEKEYQNYP